MIGLFTFEAYNSDRSMILCSELRDIHSFPMLGIGKLLSMQLDLVAARENVTAMNDVFSR